MISKTSVVVWIAPLLLLVLTWSGCVNTPQQYKLAAHREQAVGNVTFTTNTITVRSGDLGFLKLSRDPCESVSIPFLLECGSAEAAFVSESIEFKNMTGHDELSGINVSTRTSAVWPRRPRSYKLLGGKPTNGPTGESAVLFCRTPSDLVHKPTAYTSAYGAVFTATIPHDILLRILERASNGKVRITAKFNGEIIRCGKNEIELLEVYIPLLVVSERSMALQRPIGGKVCGEHLRDRKERFGSVDR